MEREKESFKVWTDASRRIVYSKGKGVAHAHEIEWLYTNLVDLAKDWNDDKGFAYMAFIEELQQVSPKGSGQYVKLHETLAQAGCKCIAYIRVIRMRYRCSRASIKRCRIHPRQRISTL
ncbi:MAG: hypothetical protein IKX95_06535 [Lachnospiraceae bacterium]|nr:hypothetical protein [Lachnospiraceae bacterium]